MDFEFFKRNNEIMYTNNLIGLIPMKYIENDALIKADKVYEFAILEYKSQEFIGRISYRIGDSEQLYYLGDIGYTIIETYRGNNYAFHSCCLIKKFIKSQGFNSAIITNDVDNYPSRKICQKLGAELLEIISVPLKYRIKFGMKNKKCRYKWNL